MLTRGAVEVVAVWGDGGVSSSGRAYTVAFPLGWGVGTGRYWDSLSFTIASQLVDFPSVGAIALSPAVWAVVIALSQYCFPPVD